MLNDDLAGDGGGQTAVHGGVMETHPAWVPLLAHSTAITAEIRTVVALQGTCVELRRLVGVRCANSIPFNYVGNPSEDGSLPIWLSRHAALISPTVQLTVAGRQNMPPDPPYSNSLNDGDECDSVDGLDEPASAAAVAAACMANSIMHALPVARVRALRLAIPSFSDLANEAVNGGACALTALTLLRELELAGDAAPGGGGVVPCAAPLLPSLKGLTQLTRLCCARVSDTAPPQCCLDHLPLSLVELELGAAAGCLGAHLSRLTALTRLLTSEPRPPLLPTSMLPRHLRALSLGEIFSMQRLVELTALTALTLSVTLLPGRRLARLAAAVPALQRVSLTHRGAPNEAAHTWGLLPIVELRLTPDVAVGAAGSGGGGGGGGGAAINATRAAVVAGELLGSSMINMGSSSGAGGGRGGRSDGSSSGGAIIRRHADDPAVNDVDTARGFSGGVATAAAAAGPAVGDLSAVNTARLGAPLFATTTLCALASLTDSLTHLSICHLDGLLATPSELAAAVSALTRLVELRLWATGPWPLHWDDARSFPLLSEGIDTTNGAHHLWNENNSSVSRSSRSNTNNNDGSSGRGSSSSNNSGSAVVVPLSVISPPAPKAYQSSSSSQPAAVLMPAVASLPSLRHLSLSLPGLGDAAAALLAPASDLTHLKLRACGLGRSALDTLAPVLLQLRSLALEYNRAIRDDDLVLLTSLQQLVELDLRYTAVTAAGAVRLQVLLPGLTSVHV